MKNPRLETTLNTELGPVTALLQGNGHAFLRVDHNTQGLLLRDKVYIGSLHAVLDGDTFVPHKEHYASWSVKDGDWRKEVAPTFKKRLTEVVLAALNAWVASDPLLLKEADVQWAEEAVEGQQRLHDAAAAELRRVAVDLKAAQKNLRAAQTAWAITVAENPTDALVAAAQASGHLQFVKVGG